MAYATVTLSGTYRRPDGTPHSGSVSVIPSVPRILDQDGNVILAGGVTAKLDASGSFSVTVPASDDPGLDPTGFFYWLRTSLAGGVRVEVGVELRAADPAVDISELTPADPGEPSYTERVEQATLAAERAAASELAAGTSADQAAGSASAAASSASSAASSASGADASEAEAGSAAGIAVEHSSRAAGSAAAADASATAAASSEDAASASAVAAAGSEFAADQSAANAAGSATAAAGSASTASSAATTAARAELTTHEAAPNPHYQYARTASANTFTTTQTIDFAGLQLRLKRTNAPVDLKLWWVYAEADGNIWVVPKADDGVTTSGRGTIIGRDGSLRLGDTRFLSGNGSPEAVVPAAVGSRYVDNLATAGAVEWVKASGSIASTTGWQVVYGDTGWRSWTVNTPHASGDSFTGVVRLRRVGRRVTLKFDGATLQPGNGYAYIFDSTKSSLGSIPLGFRGPLRSFGWVAKHNNAVDPERISHFSNVVAWVGTGVASGSNATRPSLALLGDMDWLTEDPWPTSLPGNVVI